MVSELTLSHNHSSSGRWVSWDPLTEDGFAVLSTNELRVAMIGRNLSVFIDNNPVNNFDLFGLTIPPNAEDCYGAHPLYPDDPACDSYGQRTYRGVSLRCFCKCPLLTDAWSLYVRGCLSCMDGKGVSVVDAHNACYASADKNYTRPTAALAGCFCRCYK